VQFAPLRNEILSKTGATLFLRAPKRHNDRATKEASTVMYDIDTKSQFLELRAKGCSLSRIAERLKVSQRTLVDWNRQEHEQIRTLRAIEWEALQEKILATHEQELVRLKKELDRLEAERDCRGGVKIAPFLPRFCLRAPPSLACLTPFTT
jgi:transposase-like protein